jgi:hypothetical protein
MAKKSPSPKAVASSSEGKYSVTIVANGETRSASADTVADALLALGTDRLKTKVALTATNTLTGKSFTRGYLPRMANRFLAVRPVAEAFGKVLASAIG